jgi:ubiquinone/menaquinone biosynthesis C-methylase UbiE
VNEKRSVQRFFARHASGYSVSESHRAGKDLRLLIEHLALSPTDRGLDVGTGVGHTALAIGPLVREVVGLDLTPQMGEEFHANCREAGAGNLRFVVGDVESLPFPDGAFDVLTCRRSAHHFPDPARAVREMARVLGSGGSAGLVDMSTPDDHAAATLVNEIETVRDSSHARALPPSQWKETLAAAGLVVSVLTVIVDRVPWLTWIHPVSADGDELPEAMRVLEAAEPAIRDQVAEGGHDGGVFLKRRIVAVARKL